MKKHSRNNGSSKGFVTVGMIGSLSIIAVLIGLLLPAVQKVRVAPVRTNVASEQPAAASQP